MMNLGNLKKAKGSTKDKRRVGRGKGSGMGNQATKGHDGQKGRSGKTKPYAGFEGGQMRLVRILPKRGFTSPNRVEYSVVNLSSLESTFDANTDVTLELMVEKGLVKNLHKPVKVLARGEISKPLTVQANRFSNSAKDKIEKAGGKAEVI
jgi:large subunit ribosomal protein L15